MRLHFLTAALVLSGMAIHAAPAAVEKSETTLPQKIELATWNIPLMVESKDKGLFIELVREIGQRSHTKINVSVQPTGQAMISFSSSKVHGYFPAHAFSMAKNAIHTQPFYTKNDYIFFRKNQKLTSLKDLEGKKVGLTFRYFYDPEILNNKKIRIEYADDDFVNMKKLGEGVIDAFVVEERSGMRALQQSGFANISFDRNEPVSAKPIFFAFENTSQGEALKELFDKSLGEMKKDGYLDRLFSSHK